LTSLATADKSYALNINLLEQLLGDDEIIVMELPLPNGQFVSFKLSASQIMNSELAVKYPSIRTFTGYQLDKPEHQGNFDITPQGFHGVFTFEDDKVFIDPINRNNRLTYHSYFRKNAVPLSLQALGKRLAPRRYLSSVSNGQADENKLSEQNAKAAETITYRIAVAATAEYSTFHNGTKESSLAAIVTMLNRVNEVYQRDLAIKLELVANNDSIIFLDATTDPFNNTDEDIDISTEVINNAIGVDNYDIGHVVGTGGGGLAGLGVVCTAAKAEGVTGSDSPTNDAFNIDYVAHEIGHQFGAEHTFNGALDACAGNRMGTSAYEPGSASTIMGYAGICGQQNLQNSSDPYFHLHSIEQINAFTRSGAGNTCGGKSTQSNQTPSVNAGNDYTIPARTPFTLSGQATDAESDSLTYSWEQYDLGPQANTQADDNTDDGERPLFRVFSPKTLNERTFPALNDILSGNSTFGETLPTTNRDLNFRLVVRDNNGNVNNDAMKVTVISSAQGFSITEPNLGASWQGEEQTVIWQTANTQNAPVSCATVDILLSIDSGNNFSQVLVSETPNDGNQLVNFSNLTTEKARIKVVCNNNIFFAISSGDITINSSGITVETKPVFVSQKTLTVNEDQTLTLNKSDLTFSNDQSVDNITVVPGNDYQFDGLKVTPTENFNGELLVKLTAVKGSLISDEFIVTVAVSAINDAPVAEDDSASFVEDSNKNSIDVLANDNDIENNELTIKSVSYSGGGSVVIENNKLIYTPASGFSGAETLTYIINDGELDSVPATLSITVTAKPVVEPPVEPPVEPKKSSSGGVSFYLLALMLVTIRRFKGVS
jgi:hypothetical protein